MKNAKLIALAVASLLVVAVVLQNTESVETRILFMSVVMPRAVLLFVTLVVGVVIGLLGGLRLNREGREDGGKPPVA